MSGAAHFWICACPAQRHLGTRCGDCGRTDPAGLAIPVPPMHREADRDARAKGAADRTEEIALWLESHRSAKVDLFVLIGALRKRFGDGRATS